MLLGGLFSIAVMFFSAGELFVIVVTTIAATTDTDTLLKLTQQTCVNITVQ